jgi:hypothetical protein
MTQKLQIALKIFTESDGQYFHVKTWPMYLKNDQWEYFTDISFVTPALPSIMATCQCDRHHRSDFCQDSYAWEIVKSQHVDITLAEAQSLVKILTPIVHRMDKLAILAGQPKTFGQFCLRFARAIGASKVIYTNRNGNDQERSIDVVVDVVDRLITDWHEPVQKTA